MDRIYLKSVMNDQSDNGDSKLLRANYLSTLESCMQIQLSGRVRALRLEARERGIVLRGLAGTYYAKQLAQHAVMQASGYPILANEIEVC